MPDHLKDIVTSMIKQVSENGSEQLNLEQFTKWLDRNQAVRNIIRESVKP